MFVFLSNNLGRFLFITIFGLAISACTINLEPWFALRVGSASSSVQPKFKVGDCLYSQYGNEYYKILGIDIRDKKYTWRGCLESMLIQFGKEVCFSNAVIVQMDFESFENSRDGNGNTHPLAPILCSEIK